MTETKLETEKQRQGDRQRQRQRQQMARSVPNEPCALFLCPPPSAFFFGHRPLRLRSGITSYKNAFETLLQAKSNTDSPL